MNITFAEQNEVQENQKKIDKLLKILGHPEAAVSDESWIGDFISGKLIRDGEKILPFIDKEKSIKMFAIIPGSREKELTKLKKKLKIGELKLTDRIVDIAKRMN